MQALRHFVDGSVNACAAVRRDALLTQNGAGGGNGGWSQEQTMVVPTGESISGSG